MKAQSATLSGGRNSLPCLHSRLHVALFLALAQLLCMQVLQVLRCQHCVLLLPGPVLALFTWLTAAGVCSSVGYFFVQTACPTFPAAMDPPAPSSTFFTYTNQRASFGCEGFFATSGYSGSHSSTSRVRPRHAPVAYTVVLEALVAF